MVGTEQYRDGARPLGYGARSGGGWVLERAWSLPARRCGVEVRRRVGVPMRDGVELLADHYVPVGRREAATVLVRCPYGRRAPFSMLNAQLLAERGYHVLLQSCRGTFGSGGVFDPMRDEAADGQDTVAWLREQPWFDGRLLTYGASYLGYVQWALMLDPPPELLGAVVLVAPHDFSKIAHRNGAFELYNCLSWSTLIAGQEDPARLRHALRVFGGAERLSAALDGLPLRSGSRTHLGTGATWFEDWLERSDLSDPFWTPMQFQEALDRISVPTLLVGGWHDLIPGPDPPAAPGPALPRRPHPADHRPLDT